MEALKEFLRKQLNSCQKDKEVAAWDSHKDYLSGKVDAYARILLWIDEHGKKNKDANFGLYGRGCSLDDY